MSKEEKQLYDPSVSISISTESKKLFETFPVENRRHDNKLFEPFPVLDYDDDTTIPPAFNVMEHRRHARLHSPFLNIPSTNEPPMSDTANKLTPENQLYYDNFWETVAQLQRETKEHRQEIEQSRETDNDEKAAN